MDGNSIFVGGSPVVDFLSFLAPLQADALITEIPSAAPLTFPAIRASRKHRSSQQQDALSGPLSACSGPQRSVLSAGQRPALPSWLLSLGGHPSTSRGFLSLSVRCYFVVRLPPPAVKSFQYFVSWFSPTQEMLNVKAKYRRSSCSYCS